LFVIIVEFGDPGCIPGVIEILVPAAPVAVSGKMWRGSGVPPMVKVTGFPEAVAAFEIVALVGLATAVMVVLAGMPGPVIDRPTSPTVVGSALLMNCAPEGDVIVVLPLVVTPSAKLRPSETWGLPPVPGEGPYALNA
jgi:hypothetical protein